MSLAAPIGRHLGTHHGHVAAFDVEVGLGEIEGDEGGRHPFHCTAITDHSRDIALGRRVAFRLVAGHLGRIEAGEVDPL